MNMSSSASSVANMPGCPSVGTFLKTSIPGLTKKPHRQVTAFGYAFVLCSDRRLPDPFLQPLDGFVMMLLDLATRQA